MRSITLLVVGATAAVTLAAQTQPTIQPGRWAITTQTQMAGMSMPETKSEQCITPESLKKDPNSWMPSGSDPKNKNCQTSDHTVKGENVSWKMSCTGPQPMTGSGEAIVKGDSYSSVMKMTMAQGEITMKIAGKRVGECR